MEVRRGELFLSLMAQSQEVPRPRFQLAKEHAAAAQDRLRVDCGDDPVVDRPADDEAFQATSTLYACPMDSK